MKYNLKALEEARKTYCEFCGSPAHGWPHHIKTRGAGGKEEPYNLIQLCGECHRKVHDGLIKRRQLVEIVAKREGMSQEELYDKLGWLIENKTPREISLKRSVLAGKTLEEVIELYLFCLEQGESSAWDRAAVVTALLETGLEPRQIGSLLGCSASLIRKYARTFNAFPREDMRVPFLSFRHHVIAAYSSDPVKWINLAADNQWSTRELQERITEKDEEERIWASAERTLNAVKKILFEKSEAADWLREELEVLLGKGGKEVRLSA